MSFQKVFGEIRSNPEFLAFLERLGKKDAVRWFMNGDKLTYDVQWGKLSLDDHGRLIDGCNKDAGVYFEDIYMWSKVVAEGPKIFNVEQIDFESLVHTDINLPISEYVQPFPTIVIQLPQNFRKNRIIRPPLDWSLLLGKPAPETAEPDSVILHYKKEFGTIFADLVFDTHITILTSFTVAGDTLIEDALLDKITRINGDEKELVTDVVRGAMNFCFLIDELGSHKLGSDNPSYDARLQRYLQMAQRSGDQERVCRVTRDIRLQPVRYVLDQKVKLFKTVASDHDLPVNPTGITKGPHHRRGHYRMQACGVAFSERKRIRIPPVFVNAHLYFGKMSDSVTTYEA